jgi:L-lactate utilization protein LutC
VARFCAECAAAGGLVHVVSDRAAAVAKVVELVRARAARKALLGRGPFLDSLPVADQLRPLGVEVVPVDTLTPATSRDAFFAADIGISGVDYLIAETGTVVLGSRPDEPRSLSLLPPVHIAVAESSQLLPDLFDLFAVFPGVGARSENTPPRGAEKGPALPSCLSLITGPSKTGDIELRLVTGVHGPGEIHVILAG